MLLYFKHEHMYFKLIGLFDGSDDDKFTLRMTYDEPDHTTFPFNNLDEVLLTLERDMWLLDLDYELYVGHLNDLIIKKNGGYN